MFDRRLCLVWLLRLFGGMAALALPTIFLPVGWMAEIHAWLGLGTFPESGITDYLARSLSMFYGLVGVLIVFLSMDVDRYRPLIAYVGWGSTVAGPLLLGIGLHAGLPWWWTYHEGPSSTAFGLLVLFLLRKWGHSPFPPHMRQDRTAIDNLCQTDALPDRECQRQGDSASYEAEKESVPI
jgi:hypothetical protein